MRYLSVCSGIEAATVAWHPLGWSPAAFSEIEKFPRAVLAHHYPDVPLHGDFTTIGAGEYGPIDLLVGGTPCQSFSIAGLRGGMADDRGNLALEYLRLADRTRPRWLVWENVPGVLSSNEGRDFGSILGGMAELGYGFAYAVLDAQHFGVPQRRRRVFVVGYLGDWRRAAAVLFERESLRGDSPPRRQKGQVAPTIPARSLGGGGLGTDFDCDGGLISSTGNVAHCLNAGGMGRQDYETETLIAHTLSGEGFDASEDGTGRGTPLVPVHAIQERAVSENPDAGPDGAGFRSDGMAYTLEARATVQAVCIHADAINRTGVAATPSPDAEGRVRLRDAGTGILDDGTSYNLTTGQPHAICFTAKDYGADAMDDCSPKRRAGGHDGSHQNGGVMPAVAYDLRGREGGAQLEGPHDTANIRAASGGSSRSYVQQSAVRRLTPEECEKLQGFEPGYTAIPWGKKPASECPDGPRYKALGNSMAVPCMAWLGERIQQVENLTKELQNGA